MILLFVFHCSVESAKDGSKKEEVQDELFCSGGGHSHNYNKDRDACPKF